jgi:rfaE bifunctional protein kinase chain/domain
LRVDRGSPVGEVAGPRLAQALARAVRGADALVVSDYGAGSAGSWAVAPCAALARQVPVLVDSRFHLSRFREVTVAKPNTPELAALGAPGRRGPSVSPRQLASLARRVLRRQRLSALLVTRGQDGLALYARGQKAFELPVSGPREAVDVTGAGDTVLAVFSAVFARTHDLRAAALTANVAGGLVVQKPGTAAVTADELAQALAGEGTPRRSLNGPRGLNPNVRGRVGYGQEAT